VHDTLVADEADGAVDEQAEAAEEDGAEAVPVAAY